MVQGVVGLAELDQVPSEPASSLADRALVVCVEAAGHLTASGPAPVLISLADVLPELLPSLRVVVGNAGTHGKQYHKVQENEP